MNSIYVHIKPWKITAARVIAILFIIAPSVSIVIITGTKDCIDILIFTAVILYSFPLALNPKDHLRTYLAKMSDIYENLEAYESSIKKSDQLMQHVGLYFFILWLLGLLIY